MDRRRRWMLTAVMCIVIVSFAVTAVTAGSWILNSTPLYTLRMEQHSHEMSFLPTERSTFAYTTINGFTLNSDIPTSYCASYCGGVTPRASAWGSCFPTECNTCDGTCGLTCHYQSCYLKC